MSNVIKAVSEYLSNEELTLFEKTYQDKYHEYKGLEIYPGYKLTDYIDNIILRLSEFKVAPESLYVALLVKSKKNDLKQIEEIYGNDTKIMLEALAKIDGVKEKTNNDIDNDNYRKIFLALAKDYRVIVLKLVMQEQLLLSINDIESDHAKNLAQESLDVFSPIAHRLGISSIKTNLENKSLYILNNEDYIYI